MMNSFKFELGTKVEDRVTHFKGRITGRCEYSYGVNSYLVESIDTTNRPIEMWVAEDRLERA